MKFISLNVTGGWRTAMSDPDDGNIPFGPAFNKIQDLWLWQRKNLPPAFMPTDAIEPFVVNDDTGGAPSISGNGFWRLRVGGCRAEAVEFVSWLNARLGPPT